MYIPFIFKAEIICINHLLPLRDTFKFLFVAVTQFRRLRMQSGITYQTYLVCGVQTFTIFLTKLLKKKDVYLCEIVCDPRIYLLQNHLMFKKRVCLSTE